jgi:hypothetical protein
MKNSKAKIYLHLFYILLACSLLVPTSAISCTIVSGVASDGQVWNANNEDGPVGVANFINVFPKSGNANYGYYTLSYFLPELGQGGSIQGGMNEAGLTFDFNSINRVKDFDPKIKEAFPEGDIAILPHILATMSSTQEVVDFFNTYWFQNGFHSAQMHVADRHGKFAIISASGVRVAENGQPLVSTNFDICGKEDGASCWRYPIATSKITSLGASLSTMMTICRETAQKNGTSLYSNIQNLTTGDVWFFSKHDPNAGVVSTNINELLSRERKSYTFSDLNSLIEERTEYKWSKPVRKDLQEDIVNKYTGTYYNEFTGNIVIDIHEDGITLTTEDGKSQFIQPLSKSEFFWPEEDARLEFSFDRETNKMTFDLYENGFWSFTAWQKDPKIKDGKN